MTRRIAALIRKEFLHITRDLRSLAVVFLMPVLMILIYGYAVTFDIREITLAVLDSSRSAESRELIRSLTGSGYFKLTAVIDRRSEIEPLFLERRARAVLVIPADYTEELQKGRAEVQIIIDGADANTATVAANTLRSALMHYSLDNVAVGFQPPLRIESRVWYNPDLKSTHFIVPGLIAVIMMMICALLTSVTIARERETGTMEQILVSPIRPFEFMIGKMTPYVLLALLDGLFVILFSRLVFGVPFRGSEPLFAALSVLFVSASLSIGLLISTVVRTQQAAMMIALISTIMPSLLLSGFLYPIPSLPWVLRLISYAVPAKYFLVIDRGIILKGIGFSALHRQTLFLLVFNAVFLTLSIKNFKARL